MWRAPGSAVNNTSQDRKRYLPHGRACLSTQTEANSVVAYWNNQSPTCRALGSSQNGDAHLAVVLP
jgi:hypothetical protein